ncbi:MAG: transcription antitermination factor NusB [Gammaproteobacteria bacterium]|nr:transcription antitermination factor NusB [Gammaproteobacteria bacterium]MCZ6497704.1 transcription antitermination factor NusB [Gammaproteobacteria bacterium]MCZ6585641.1 transcription antitermination factor NusB [Gammaproteobacteria bacterium]TDJ30210.1 MAG: transcription antitermination factor NusB [Gammaproteobacteria bacterium]
MPAQDNSSVRARQGARDLLIKALYQWQLGGHDREELLEQFALEPEYAQIDKRYFRELLAAVIANVTSLDSLITTQADRDVKTVDVIGRAVLLLGLEELNSRPDVPTKVVINEAVELAKRYGAPDCFRFVNAVLDKAAKVIKGRSPSVGGG